MKEFVISEAQTERAVLVGLITQNQNERKTNEYLDELAFLAETAGAEVVKRFTQKLDYPNTVSYVGKGKLQEIKEYLAVQNEEEETEIGMVIFDDELSAKQLRNIENELKVKILDRTSLILDILPCVPRLPMPRRRWSWHNINICCPACSACGLTWNVREVVPEPEVERVRWVFADRVKPSWKWTAVSFEPYGPAETASGGD